MDQNGTLTSPPPVTPRLPVAHADALALTAAGVDPDLIAARLGLPREALAPLLDIATSKVHTLLDAPRSR